MKPTKDNRSSIRKNETLPYEPENKNTHLDSQSSLSRNTKPSHRIVVTWNMKNSISKGSQYIFNQIHEDCSLERITCGFHGPEEGKRSQDETSVRISERDKPILTWHFPSISADNVTFATQKTYPRSDYSNIQKSISTSGTLSQQSACCSRQSDTESTELQDVKANCSKRFSDLSVNIVRSDSETFSNNKHQHSLVREEKEIFSTHVEMDLVQRPPDPILEITKDQTNGQIVAPYNVDDGYDSVPQNINSQNNEVAVVSDLTVPKVISNKNYESDSVIYDHKSKSKPVLQIVTTEMHEQVTQTPYLKSESGSKAGKNSQITATTDLNQEFKSTIQTTRHPIQVTEATDLKACKETSNVKPGSESMPQTTSSHIHPRVPTSISVNPIFKPESQTKINQIHPEVTATLDINSEYEPVSQTTRDLTHPQDTTTSYLYPRSVTQTDRSQIRTQVMETPNINPDIEPVSRTTKKQIPAQVVESPNVKTRSEDVSTTNTNETHLDVTVEPDLNPASDKTRYETANNTDESQIYIKVTTTDRKPIIGSDSKYKSHIHSPYTLARDRLPAPIQSCESVIELTITDLTAAHRENPEITVTEPTTNRAISDLRNQVSHLRDRLRYLEHKSSRTKFTSKKTSEEIAQIQNRLCTFSRSIESLLNQNGLPRTANSTVERQTKRSDVNANLILAPAGGYLRRNLLQRSILSDDDSIKSLGNGSAIRRLKPDGSLKCQPPRLVGIRATGQNFKSLQSESRRGWNCQSECRSCEDTVGYRSDISNSTFETGSLCSEASRNILHSSPTMDNEQDAKRRRQRCIISSKRFISRIVSDSDSERGTIYLGVQEQARHSDRTSGSGVENEVATSTINGSCDRQNSIHDLDHVPELLKNENTSSCTLAESCKRGVNKFPANHALQNSSRANARRTSEVVRQSSMENGKDKVDVSSQAVEDVMRVTGGGCDCEKDPASCICGTSKTCEYPSCQASKSEQVHVKRRLSIYIPGESLYERSNSVTSEEIYSNRHSIDGKSSVSELTTIKDICTDKTCSETKVRIGETCETEKNQSCSESSKTNGRTHISGQEEDVKNNTLCGLCGLSELRKRFIRTLLSSKSRKTDKEAPVDETKKESLQSKLDEMSEDLDEQKKATDELFTMCKECMDMYNGVTKKLNEVIEEVEAIGTIVRGKERKISDLEPIFTRPSNVHTTLSSFAWKHMLERDSFDKLDNLEERRVSFISDIQEEDLGSTNYDTQSVHSSNNSIQESQVRKKGNYSELKKRTDNVEDKREEDKVIEEGYDIIQLVQRTFPKLETIPQNRENPVNETDFYKEEAKPAEEMPLSELLGRLIKDMETHSNKDEQKKLGTGKMHNSNQPAKGSQQVDTYSIDEQIITNAFTDSQAPNTARNIDLADNVEKRDEDNEMMVSAQQFYEDEHVPISVRNPQSKQGICFCRYMSLRKTETMASPYNEENTLEEPKLQSFEEQSINTVMSLSPTTSTTRSVGNCCEIEDWKLPTSSYQCTNNYDGAHGKTINPLPSERVHSSDISLLSEDGRQSCNCAVGFCTAYIDLDSRVRRQASHLNHESKPDDYTQINNLRFDENHYTDRNSLRDQLSSKEEKNQDNNSKKSTLLLRAEDHSSWKSYLFQEYGKLQTSHIGSVAPPIETDSEYDEQNSTFIAKDGNESDIISQNNSNILQEGTKLNNYSGNGVIDPENETKRNRSSVKHPFVMKIDNRLESKSQNSYGTKLKNISRNCSFGVNGRKSDNRSRNSLFGIEDEVESDKTPRKILSISQNETKRKNSSQMSPFVHQTANKSDIVPQNSDFLLQDEAKLYNTLQNSSLVSKDKNKSNRSLASSFTCQTGTTSRSSLRNRLILSQERMRTDSYSQRNNYVSQDELKSNNYPQRNCIASPAQTKSGKNSQKHTTFSPGSENSANNLRRVPSITFNRTKLDSRSRVVSIEEEEEEEEEEDKDESSDGKILENISKKSFSDMQPPRANYLGKHLQRNFLGLFYNGEIKQDTNSRRSSLLFLENNISERRTATPHNKHNSESIPQCSFNRKEDNSGHFLQTNKRKRRRSKTSLGPGSERTSFTYTTSQNSSCSHSPLHAPIIIIPTCQRSHWREHITEHSAIDEESVENDKKNKRKYNCVFL